MPSQLQNLFGEEIAPATKKITLLTIEARFRREVLREDAPLWVSRRFTSPAGIYEMFRDLESEAREVFVSLHLDGKNRIVCMDKVSVGSLNQTIVHPREVFKTALLSSAAALIVIHNHPSGDPMPSSEDLAITKRLKEASELLGIRLLDHIIIGRGCFQSLCEAGHM